MNPLLVVEDLQVRFRVSERGWFKPDRELKAVDGVSLSLETGRTLGVVGESGCGKSTLARAILGLVPVTSGSVRLLGDELVGLDRKALRARRQIAQIVFQDPLAALNPRMTVGEIVAEPLTTYRPGLTRAERRTAVGAVMECVGLLPNQINRYPHEFSGGQCQRIGIARALVLKPRLILCDEPVSALDVSIQAQIVNLLMDLQRDMQLALLFIAHDLSVVRHISHQVLVMYLGRVVELADRATLYKSPRHPYTRALMSAVPIPDPRRERAKRAMILEGDLPSPLAPPTGCTFRTRCPHARDVCAEEVPALRAAGDSLAACHRLGEFE